MNELIQRVSSAFTSAGERSGMSASEQLRFSWLEYGVLVTCRDNIDVFSQSEKWESSICEILKKLNYLLRFPNQLGIESQLRNLTRKYPTSL